MTTLAVGELVTAIELPRPIRPRGTVHVRRTRRRGHDLASVTLACAVDDGGVTRIAYGSLGPRPWLVRDDTGLLADPGGLGRREAGSTLRALRRRQPLADVAARRSGLPAWRCSTSSGSARSALAIARLAGA